MKKTKYSAAKSFLRMVRIGDKEYLKDLNLKELKELNSIIYLYSFSTQAELFLEIKNFEKRYENRLFNSKLNKLIGIK